jgi:hypothetical protein
MAEQELTMCPECGAAVIDNRKHRAWHDSMTQTVTATQKAVKAAQQPRNLAARRARGGYAA